MTQIKNPHVFISYAQEEETKINIEHFATKLMSDGVNVTIDFWDLKEGQNMYRFMEKCVSDPSIDFVLLLCTPLYTKKANDNAGGVGTESTIIMPEIYNNAEQTKFLPIIFSRDESNNFQKPYFLNSLIHFDLTNNNYEKEYQKIIRTLFGKPEQQKPEIGNPPTYLNTQKKQLKTDKVRLSYSNINYSNIENRLQFFYDLKDDLDIFDIEYDKIKEQDLYTLLNQKYIEIQPLKENLVGFLKQCISNIDNNNVLLNMLDDLLPILYKKTNFNKTGTYNSAMFDHFKVLLHETLLLFASLLIKYQKYTLFYDFCSYSFPNTNSSAGMSIRLFLPDLRLYPECLSSGGSHNKISYPAHLIKENMISPITFSEICVSDYLMYINSIVIQIQQASNYFGDLWFPVTMPYSQYKQIELLHQLESIRRGKEVCKMFGFDNLTSLKSFFQSDEFLEFEMEAQKYSRINISRPSLFSTHLKIEDIGKYK
ncbi:hypothetical protein EK33_03130 [Listeria monocytogenes]|nr:hypothetical protein [Listeria monocytogenes]